MTSTLYGLRFVTAGSPIDQIGESSHSPMKQDEKLDLLYVVESAAGEVVGFALGRREASWEAIEQRGCVAACPAALSAPGHWRALIAAVAAELKQRGHSTLIL